MSDELTGAVKRIFSTIQKVPEDEIDLGANIFERYGVDSLRAVKLLSSLEVELDVEVPDEDVRNIKTLNDVIDVTRRALDASNA